MHFVPMNRHLWVKPPSAEADPSGIVLPEAYAEAQQHTVVEVISAAPDCKAFDTALLGNRSMVGVLVPTNMLVEVTAGPMTYTLVQENYILGYTSVQENYILGAVDLED